MHRHLSVDHCERYVVGPLSDRATRRIEIGVLSCERCHERVGTWIGAEMILRHAALEAHRREPRRPRERREST